MDFAFFIQIIKRTWWTFVAVFVIVLGSTAYFTYTQTPIYRATVSFVVLPDENAISSGDFIRSLSTLERRSFIATSAKILSSKTIQKRAHSKIGITNSQSISYHIRSYHIRSSVVPDTNIIRVSVSGTNPRIVTDIANAMYDEGQNYIKEFYSVFELRLLDPATLPSSSVRPSIRRNFSIAIVMGILLGLGAMIVIYYFRQTRGNPNKNSDSKTNVDFRASQG
jgi:capsular polysaccharide biosynthesis protein